ncbi:MULTISPECIES: hypothetical protein [Streptomyces]|uniref:hypothetical protein n=1 Tax=Streptomyces TaxID=1883 RepID=UPI0001D06DB9|nr:MULTISPECIES: hypothetical protein [Streptomyces]MYS46109.1 hypothetical protein [Streptomyces sp. SID5998]MYX41040.1 hypothetical protein [Streptomyces sp. SID89]NED36079.1 hypothetical protein [Streptomyces sp. SID8499]NED71147.1 hypothetical protein [Streptomyces sp. SID9944]EFF90796.1 conserved hypothetical protein [Streptomyces sp. e14]
MATPYDFPSDLLAGQEELHQVRAELSALLKRLPWSVEPLDGFSDDGGWRKVERPASPGWTADEQAEVEKLRRREHELAVFVTTHRYWAQFTGPDRVEARSRLKHACDQAPASPAGEDADT